MNKVYQFETNINCGNCISKVKPLMDEVSDISHWDVNTTVPQKTLTVETILENPDIIIRLVNQAGYTATPLIKPNTASAFLNFWGSASHWKRAGRNTLNCLIGCSIGDFGMLIFLQTFYPQTNMYLMMGMAMIAGLATSIVFESTLLRIKEGFGWKLALETAFSMSFLSMLAMELAENATDFMLTGGSVPISDPFYWFALSMALIAGFFVPLPYNYYKLKKFNKACH